VFEASQWVEGEMGSGCSHRVGVDVWEVRCVSFVFSFLSKLFSSSLLLSSNCEKEVHRYLFCIRYFERSFAWSSHLFHFPLHFSRLFTLVSIYLLCIRYGLSNMFLILSNHPS
jgi:hypothetical protein